MKCLFKSLGQKSNVRKCPVLVLKLIFFTHSLVWELCPYTFPTRQSHFRQLSQKFFEQIEEMTFDCGLANTRVAVICG